MFHVLFESPQNYFQDPKTIFYMWQGGFVFYGGLLAVLPSTYLFCKIKKQDFLSWADFFVPFISVGYIFGRLGCFLAGCCYGKSCDLPWAINNLHPTQLYAVLAEALVFLLLLSEKKMNRPKGVLFATWMIGHGIGRLFMEPFRDDFRGPEVSGLSISQILSLILVVTGVFIVTLLLQQKRSPGQHR